MDEEIGTLRKLANAELAESLACFNLRGLLQTLDRFLGHFVSPLLSLLPLWGDALLSATGAPICAWRCRFTNSNGICGNAGGAYGKRAWQGGGGVDKISCG